MPRPRKDSEILPAKERLENAFWELLTERNYRKITVTDVVNMAGVNRNSFYYHFSNMSELADSAIMSQIDAIPTPLPEIANTQQPATQWKKRLVTMISDPEHRQRLDRLALLAGPHTSPELIESLRDFGRLKLLAMLSPDAQDVDLATDLLVDFTVGGMLSILRRWPSLSKTVDIDDLLSEDVAVLAMGTYLSMNREDLLAYWNRVFSSHRGTLRTNTATNATASEL